MFAAMLFLQMSLGRQANNSDSLPTALNPNEVNDLSQDPELENQEQEKKEQQAISGDNLPTALSLNEVKDLSQDPELENQEQEKKEQQAISGDNLPTALSLNEVKDLYQNPELENQEQEKSAGFQPEELTYWGVPNLVAVVTPLTPVTIKITPEASLMDYPVPGPSKDQLGRVARPILQEQDVAAGPSGIGAEKESPRRSLTRYYAKGNNTITEPGRIPRMPKKERPDGDLNDPSRKFGRNTEKGDWGPVLLQHILDNPNRTWRSKAPGSLLSDFALMRLKADRTGNSAECQRLYRMATKMAEEGKIPNS